MSRIPTVDELVQAALGGGDISIQDTPPVEKIGASFDIMEETASELEKWAEEAEQHHKEDQKVTSGNQKETQHNQILKLAMASTILNTLQGLSDHGQLDRLVEKVAAPRLSQLAAKLRQVQRGIPAL